MVVGALPTSSKKNGQRQRTKPLVVNVPFAVCKPGAHQCGTLHHFHFSDIGVCLVTASAAWHSRSTECRGRAIIKFLGHSMLEAIVFQKCYCSTLPKKDDQAATLLSPGHPDAANNASKACRKASSPSAVCSSFQHMKNTIQTNQ